MTQLVSEPDAALQSESGEAHDACTHIDASAVVRRSEEIYWEAFDDGAVLLDERTGALHTLNATAGLLWQCLDGDTPLGDIVADFADVFGSSEVSGHLVSAARSLCSEGLLEHQEPSGGWMARHAPGHVDEAIGRSTETPPEVDELAARDPSLTIDLARQEWRYHTARFGALGFDFAVRTNDPALGRYLDDVLRSMAVAGEASEATHRYDLVNRADRCFVLSGGEMVSRINELGLALRHLLWDINQRVVASASDSILLHASAVARDDAALVLPASTGSGKTTLAAGLVDAGLDYITDEAVAFDPRTHEISPYAKPLAIEAGSWEVLENLRPRDRGDELRGVHRFHWYVAPEDIRPDAVAGASLPRLIICPTYDRLGETQLTRLSRTDAVRHMATNSFNFHERGRAGLSTLAAVARMSGTYRLTVNDLDDACRTVLSLID